MKKQTHASNDLREEFEQIIEAGEATTTNARYKAVLAALENCSDIVPCAVCEGMEIPVGSTYADAVKHCRGILHGVKIAKEVLGTPSVTPTR